MMHQRLAVLGEGITGTAVKKYFHSQKINLVSVEDADWIICSPGIPKKKLPNVRGQFISELEFSYLLLKQYFPEIPILAITGTNGKTTVTSLLGHVFNFPVFGNIGFPLIEVLSLKHIPKLIIVEVSSFQLELSKDFHANTVIYTSLSEDHIDRHGSFSAYLAEKKKLQQKQTQKDLLIYNDSDDFLPNFIKTAQAQCLPSSTSTLKIPMNCSIIESNLNCSFLAAQHYGISQSQFLKRLKTFKKPPYRLVFEKSILNRQFYNDSKSTNPASTIKAISFFKKKDLLLILSGQDKKGCLNALKKACLENVKFLFVFGEMTALIIDLFKDSHLRCYPHSTLESTLKHCFELSQPNDIILFSPAGASFDLFKNFEDRGQCFSEAVYQLSQKVINL